MLELWESTLKSLQDQMAAQHYDAWLRPIRASVDGEVLVLKVPNKFAKDWLTNNYLEMIRDNLRVARGSEITLRLDLEAAGEEAHASASISTDALAAASVPPPAPRTSPGLNPKYIFQNFVVGPSNQLAHAAALAAARDAGPQVQPPLHLRRRGPRQDAPRARDRAPRCTSASRTCASCTCRPRGSRTTSSLLAEATHGRVPRALPRAVRRAPHRRHPVPRRREQTQEEFFHTFNALHDGYKQIVVTSDKIPARDPRSRGAARLALPVGPRRRHPGAGAGDPRRHPPQEGR